MSDRCRSCNAEVLWAKTVPAGASMPLDVREVAAGTKGALVVIYGASDRAFAYGPAELAERLAKKNGYSLARAEQLVATDYPWHLSHFSTCPNADQHRRSH